MKLLLDTHVWIWMMSGEDRKFSPRTKRAIDRARITRSCWLSTVSLWEVSTLHAKRRIKLSFSVEALLEEAAAVPGIELVPLSAAAAWEAGTLSMHGDPADRLIVATARELDATLVTSDTLILDRPSLCRTLAAH